MFQTTSQIISGNTTMLIVDESGAFPKAAENA